MRRPFRGERRHATLLLLPGLLVIAAVALYPIVSVLWLSLQHHLPIFGIATFAGLENYRALLQDTRLWRSLGTTLYFTAGAVGLELVLGLAIATQLARSFPGRGVARAALLIPWALPPVVSAKMWEWLYNADFGLLNYLLRSTGLVSGGVNWLGSPTWALHAAIGVEVWKATPFVALLLLAGMQLIPPDLYEAARVDGAGSWTRFRRITLPLLLPVLLVVLLFRTMDALRTFDIIFVLTGGGPANTTETLSIYTYKVLFQTLQFGYGSALATVTFAAAMLVALGYMWLLPRRAPGRERTS